MANALCLFKEVVGDKATKMDDGPLTEGLKLEDEELKGSELERISEIIQPKPLILQSRKGSDVAQVSQEVNGRTQVL